MGEGQTEREALLEARVKELEAAAALPKGENSGGGTIEQVWRYFSAFVPPWIIAGGVVVFLGFHAWEYYNKGQIAAAETQIAKAQAAMKDADARARNTKVGDEPVQLATAKAQLLQKQQEAARAKIEADAQNATIEDATTRLATLKAELAAKQAQATKARAAADAAGARFGVQTLEQRAVRANLILTELEVVQNRMSATIVRSNNGSVEQTGATIVRAACENNKYAELVGCPRQFLQQQRRP